MDNQVADIKDNSIKIASSGKDSDHYVQFDGLRGVATTLVVLSHCNLIIHGGGFANAIFFVLSGFLIINPFKERSEERFMSLWGILRFYGSRAVRIIPGYYLVLVLMRIQTGYYWITKEEFISLFCFTEIWGHFWFIFSYFWITFFIPYIMLLFLLAAKKIKALKNDLVCSVIFYLMAGIIRIIVLRLDVFDNRLDQLMIGIGAGYLCRYIRNNEKFKRSISQHKVIGDVIILFTVFFMFLISSRNILDLISPGLGDTSFGWEYLFLSAVMMSILVVLICLFNQGLSARLFSLKPLVFVGKLSYYIYLINYLLTLQFRPYSDVFWFICVFSVSIVLSYILDSVISSVVKFFKNRLKQSYSLSGS